jgi:hypothetical protein
MYKSGSSAEALDQSPFLVDRYDGSDLAFAGLDLSSHRFDVVFGRNVTPEKENASYGPLLEILDDLAEAGIGIFRAEKSDDNHLSYNLAQPLVSALSRRIG